jgi:Ser/Thr protein kinase RdoA (MazF antagonist)
MQRDEILQICESQVLEIAAARFGTRKDALKKFPEYEGAANLVYEYEIDNKPLILRISFTPERTLEQIQAELRFVKYLSENGVKVSEPVASQNGNLIETILAAGIPFRVVTFTKGKGMRVPDNGYLYRPDAPLEEYFHNWGRILGQMHALAKNYPPEPDGIKRPEWFDLHQRRLAVVNQLPGRLHRVQMQIQSLLDELRSLPRDKDSFGLVHGDFNDGNFTVDYSNGDITVFDFDDCCTFWFMYEIASAWQAGTGRTMFRGLAERKSFMEGYMEHLMEGYNQQNSLSEQWLERLPLFTSLLQVEEFLDPARYLEEPDDELQGELSYKIKCIENGIPYMGFFDEIYSPEKPFSLQPFAKHAAQPSLALNGAEMKRPLPNQPPQPPGTDQWQNK